MASLFSNLFGSANAANAADEKEKKSKSSPSSCSTPEWRSKINKIQSAQVTPEIRKKLLQRAESKRLASARVMKSKAVRSSAKRAVKSWNMAQSSVQSISAKYSPSPQPLQRLGFGGGSTSASAATTPSRTPQQQQEYHAEMEEAMTKASDELMAVQELNTSSINDYMTPSLSLVGSSLVRMADSEDDMDEAAEEADIQADISEFQTLLQKIITEPTEDEDIAANFKLYEQYLETVELVRKSVFDLWEESKDSFPASAKATIERDFAQIDGHANMEINFDSGRWFVYEMTRKAEANRQLLLTLSRSIQTRLELLAAENDCPICLEAMGGQDGQPVTVLGCCHSVCTDCWTHWMEMKHGHAFCPLCRHEEFLSEVLIPAAPEAGLGAGGH